ncbi:hypothetical protein D3C71_1560410 [compost metagenome]
MNKVALVIISYTLSSLFYTLLFGFIRDFSLLIIELLLCNKGFALRVLRVLISSIYFSEFLLLINIDFVQYLSCKECLVIHLFGFDSSDLVTFALLDFNKLIR